MRHHRATVTSPRSAARVPTRPREPVTVIDAGVALDLLAAAVERNGEDFVYQPVWVDQGRYLTCRYASQDAPDCIVGHALAGAGVDVAVLEEMSDSGVEDLYLEGRFPVPVTLGGLAVLRAAQHSQDRGCSWGEVLAHARDTAVRFLDLVSDASLATGASAAAARPRRSP